MAQLNGVTATAKELQSLALVNYGHFTSMRVDDQRIRGLSHHMDRLVKDCREVFGTDLDTDRVRDYVRQALEGRTGSFIVRVSIFDPALDLGNLGGARDPHVLVTTRGAGSLPAEPLRVQSVEYVRDHPLVKHVGLYGALRHRRNAQLNGFDDALFVDSSRMISEGATWNVAFFDGANIIWPDSPILPGVTMRIIQELREKSITAPVSLDDLPNMQAAFATNTSVGARKITQIDGFEFPEECPELDALQRDYQNVPGEAL